MQFLVVVIMTHCKSSKCISISASSQIIVVSTVYVQHGSFAMMTTDVSVDMDTKKLLYAKRKNLCQLS